MQQGGLLSEITEVLDEAVPDYFTRLDELDPNLSTDQAYSTVFPDEACEISYTRELTYREEDYRMREAIICRIVDMITGAASGNK